MFNKLYYVMLFDLRSHSFWVMSEVDIFFYVDYHRVDIELSKLNYPVSTNSNQNVTSWLKQLKLKLVQHNFFAMAII